MAAGALTSPTSHEDTSKTVDTMAEKPNDLCENNEDEAKRTEVNLDPRAFTRITQHKRCKRSAQMCWFEHQMQRNDDRIRALENAVRELTEELTRDLERQR